MVFSRQAVSVLAQGAEGGGAALNEIIGLTAVATVVTAVLLWIGYLHRNRRITWLASLGDWSGRRFKRPPWVACQSACSSRRSSARSSASSGTSACTSATDAMTASLANPAHYFILIGLFGVFVSGCTAIVLPYDRPGPAAVRITDDWYAPVGGVVMAGCGMYALLGFPLDDVWHRIFGQDVTLWGPTHLMMIGGAGFSTLSALYLEHEGRKASGGDSAKDAPKDGLGLKFVQYLAFAGVLIGLSVYQIEFDFGVPQFRQVFQPMLIAAAATLALVAARIFMGPGRRLHRRDPRDRPARRDRVRRRTSARTRRSNWFPLYLGPALVVELLALTPLLKRPVIFGAGQRPGSRDGRVMGRVAVDQRRVPLPMAHEHLAGGAGDVGARRGPRRWLRRDGGHGADRQATAPPRRSVSASSR